MTIFIGADHRGFELKNKIVEYLQDKNIRVEDLGALQYEKADDASDFAFKVAQVVLQNPDYLGIVICGSGAAVNIAANRVKGVRCGIGFNADQVHHMKAWDHMNVLAIGADYFDLEKAKPLIDVFLETPYGTEERMLRRVKKLDEPV